MDSLKVVYIAGSGRSGSTLLDQILSSNNCGISVGELNAIWENGFLHNRLCSCGKQFKACEFWHAVVEDAFPPGLDIARVVQLRNHYDRMRYYGKLKSALGNKVYPATLVEYRNLVKALYRSVAKISGARVIFDSSKKPSTALLLNSIPEFDTFIIHLVRDPRGVVNSWQKKKQRHPGDSAPTKQFRASRTVMFWIFRNYYTGKLKYEMPYQLVRYEDLAQSPQEVAEAILAKIGDIDTSIPFTNGDTIEMNPGHSFSGNSARFKKGPIQIKLDDAWSHELSALHRMFTTAATLPMLRKYDYL